MKQPLAFFPCIIAALPLAGQPAAEQRPVDQLSQAAVQSAFQVLRSEYIRKDELTPDELNRAALQGLLSRLDFGAELVKKNGKPAAQAPVVHGELLAPGIAWVRPETFGEGEIALVEKRLREFKGTGARHLILDLRSPAEPGLFETAAALLDFFTPAGEALFKLRQIGREGSDLMLSRSDPVWPGRVILLADRDTCNVAEAVAAVLQKRGQAILVGSPTRGAAVLYDTVPVDDGWSLRYAKAELLLSDDSPVFKRGVQPAFRIDLAADVKREIFKSGSAMSKHVFDKARLRYNEAALVAKKNPDLDAYIKRSAGQDIEGDAQPPRDTVLQRAVDMIEASDITAGSGELWPPSAK